MPRVIQVIETDEPRGAGGHPGDPCRRVTRYYTLEGTLLAERDEWEETHLARCEKPGCTALVLADRACLAGHPQLGAA